MSGFENSLHTASLAILKRALTESERIEFLELAGTIGMNNVQDYLYMLMIFKRNEDRVSKQMDSFEDKIEARFDEISNLEKKIDDTLEKSISNMLGKGAERIGYDMGRHITDSAKDVLNESGKLQFLRGQLVSVCIMALVATVAYWLGMGRIFDLGDGKTFFGSFLWFPMSSFAVICGLIYMTTSYIDGKEWFEDYFPYRARFWLQLIALVWFLAYIALG